MICARSRSRRRALRRRQKRRDFVDHTTASAEIARELDAAATRLGFKFVDGPVSGGSAGRKRRLDGDVRRHRGRLCQREPVIAAYARMCKRLGPAGSGQLTKMVTRSASPAWSKACGGDPLCQETGLDVNAVVETISKGAAQSWQMDNRYKTMNEGNSITVSRGMDAQGSHDLSGGIAPQRREPSGHRTGQRVLFRSRENGRQALGHLEPAGAVGAVSSGTARRG